MPLIGHTPFGPTSLTELHQPDTEFQIVFEQGFPILGGHTIFAECLVLLVAECLFYLHAAYVTEIHIEFKS